ncbi:MAG: GxxExxY protein [Deltaproteobacteria bacterium]|nr:GxxExxY protein [Deltaproteobacteria bacterium]
MSNPNEIDDRHDNECTQHGLREPAADIDELAREVIGAAIEVHRTLGPGFLEPVYEGALALELQLRGIPFARQTTIPIVYRGHVVGESRIDLLVGEKLVVELKAVDELARIHFAQAISYLRAGSFQLGLLINFNTARLKDGLRRVVWTS